MNVTHKTSVFEALKQDLSKGQFNGKAIQKFIYNFCYVLVSF